MQPSPSLNTHVAIPIQSMAQIRTLVGETPTKYGVDILALLTTDCLMVHIAQPPPQSGEAATNAAPPAAAPSE